MASMMHALLTEKPKVPKFKTVDIGSEQETAVKEQADLLPELSAFAEEFNKLSAEQMTRQLERMLPGYGQLMSRGTANIRSMLAGEVPADVEQSLERKAAERGLALGYGGSEFGDNQFLRNFGLTSLQLTQQGLNAASQWMSSAASRSPVFNMASAFLPISERVSLRAAENQFQFQRDWLKNKVKAIPSGGKAAVITLFDNIEAMGRSVLMMYAGGAMGGMGGMGGGGGGGNSPPPPSDAWQSPGFDAGAMQSRAWSPSYGSQVPATSWGTPGAQSGNNFTPAGPQGYIPPPEYKFPGTFG